MITTSSVLNVYVDKWASAFNLNSPEKKLTEIKYGALSAYLKEGTWFHVYIFISIKSLWILYYFLEVYIVPIILIK